MAMVVSQHLIVGNLGEASMADVFVYFSTILQLIAPQPCYDEFFVKFNFLHGKIPASVSCQLDGQSVTRVKSF